MKRMWIMTLALAVAAPAMADEKKDDKKPSRSERFKAIIKDWQKAQEPLRVEFNKLKTEDEKEAFIAKLPALFAPFAEAAVKLAEEDPKDPAAFEALMFGIMGAQNEKAAEVMAKTQQDNARFQAVCPTLGGQGGDNIAVQKLLQLTYETATNQKLKGGAGLAWAEALYRKSEKPATTEPAKLLAQAEAVAESVQKKFGGVKITNVQGEQVSVKEQAGKLLFEIRNLAIGRTAPEVVGEKLDGKAEKLSGYRGKVVVLDIWATWCGPCKAMIPHEREMVEKLKDKPFTLISISADEEKDTLKEFLEKEKMPWVHWWEGRKEKGVLKDWNVQFFPTIYVIDHKGVIRHKGLRGKKLEEAVEKLVKAAESAK